MLNILHVIHSLDPKMGGPPRVVLDLADAQIAAGARVELLAADLRPEFIPPPVLASKPPVGHTWASVVEDLPAFLSRFDVIHCHGVWDAEIPKTARAARRIAKPYVITPHGMLDPWSLAQKRWKKKVALWLGYRAMLDGAAGLHMLNADEAALIGPLGLHSKPFVLPNGVHIPKVVPNEEDDPDFRKLLGKSPYLLFLGRIHRKKGLDFLVPAFAKLADRYPELRLLIAGPDDGDRAAIEILIRELHLDEKAVFTGPLYGQRKRMALRQASCFCLTSRQEGFSIAILEALSAGVPVVVSEACHFPEVASSGAGSVVPLDIDCIAAAIDRCLVDYSSRIRMGEAGRKLVADRYTWQAIAQQSLAIYSALTSIAC